MPFISFIYKIGNNSKTYFGKCLTDNINDEHSGLDIELKDVLVLGINEYRKQHNLSKIKKLHKKIKVGILYCSTNNNSIDYSSSEEIKCFDFYFVYYTNKEINIYINGKIIKIDENK